MRLEPMQLCHSLTTVDSPELADRSGDKQGDTADQHSASAEAASPPQNDRLGRYPGLEWMRYFFPASLTISTVILRKPSFELTAG